MYDVNPLGPMMHLKELERQVLSARLSSERESREHAGVFALAATMMAHLRRLAAMLTPQRSARRFIDV